MYLDNRNSGYQMDNSALFNAGVFQGGFANDYDGTATGVATYNFSTPLPGYYDLYAYFLSTADATMSVSVFDGANADISSTFTQVAANALEWMPVCLASNPTLCGAGPNNIIDLSTTGPYSIRVARSAGTTNMIVDGFKLVYKGWRHKIFYYDTTGGNKITFGSDNGGFAALTSNPTLLDNVSAIGSEPVFSYYGFDTSSQLVSTNRAADVALIKIAFQLNDPDGKVPPYILRGQAEIKSMETKGKKREKRGRFYFLNAGSDLHNLFTSPRLGCAPPSQ